LVFYQDLRHFSPLEMLFSMWFIIAMSEEVYTREQLNGLSKDEIISLFLDEKNKASKKISELENQLEQKDLELMYVQSKLDVQLQQRFGRSTETSSTISQLRMDFNEAEAVFAENPVNVEPTADEVVQGYKRRGKKQKGKRAEDLKGIETEIVNIEIPDDKLEALFPDGWKRLPDTIVNKLEYIPAKIVHKEIHVAVYRAIKGRKIVRADRPVDILKKSLATPSLVAGLMNYKYVNGMPLYRMEQEFKRNGYKLERQVMCSWIIRCTERYLSLFCDRLKAELILYHSLHIDETPVGVNKDGRPAGSKSEMFVYTSEPLETDHAIVLYEYQKTRNSEHPLEFLKGFHGVATTDAFSGYHTLDKISDDIEIANCWVHARRKLSDVIKINPKASSTETNKVYDMITSIMHEDKKLHDLDQETRLKKRQEEITPKVDELFAYVHSLYESGKVLPKSKTGEAMHYLLNQEKYLRVFLSDPLVPMTNNEAEQKIRPFVIGRKNWVMIDTIAGAEASAICYSIAETAKANNLKPFEYFKYLLEEIAAHQEDTDLEFLDHLLPWSEDLPDEIKNKSSK